MGSKASRDPRFLFLFPELLLCFFILSDKYLSMRLSAQDFRFTSFGFGVVSSGRWCALEVCLLLDPPLCFDRFCALLRAAGGLCLWVRCGLHFLGVVCRVWVDEGLMEDGSGGGDDGGGLL